MVLLLELGCRISADLCSTFIETHRAPDGTSWLILEVQTTASAVDAVVVLNARDRGTAGRLYLDVHAHELKYQDTSGVDVRAAPNVRALMFRPSDSWPQDDRIVPPDSAVEAFVELEFHKEEGVEEMFHSLRSVLKDSFRAAARVEGRPIIFAKMVAKDKASFDRALLNTLQADPTVRSTRTYVVLRDRHPRKPSLSPAPPPEPLTPAILPSQKIMTALRELAGDRNETIFSWSEVRHRAGLSKSKGAPAVLDGLAERKRLEVLSESMEPWKPGERRAFVRLIKERQNPEG